MSNWNKFPDTEPMDNGEYIVMIEGSKVPTTLIYSVDDGEWYEDYDETYTVTHWMPLPAPPKKEKEHCCFCGTELTDEGNNPDPVQVKGRCCDLCNVDIVVPLRMAIVEREERNYENRKS